MIRILLLAVITFPAFAQVGVGLKAGLPLNETIDVVTGGSAALASARDREYLIGPQFELRLPAGFGIELDALYSKFHISSVSAGASSAVSAVTDGDAWQFPLLLKKRFGRGVAKPFVDIGASFRHLGGLKTVGSFITGSNETTSVSTSSKNDTGFTIGGGLELKLLFIRISPEVRFTRWGTDSLSEGVTNVFKLNKNQGQFLVGFSF